MTVHSTQLGTADTVTTGTTTLYTVPTGVRSIVKWLTATNYASGANTLYVIVSNGGTTKFSFTVQMAAAPSVAETTQTQLWVVLDAGDVVKVNATSAHVSVSLSGTELGL